MTDRPLCRSCGKPIAKRFTHTSLRLSILPPAAGHRVVDQYPTTLEEAQRMVNEPVLTVRRIGYGPNPEGIVDIKSWDGQSFIGRHFCSNICAQDFGRMVAENHPEIETVDYAEAIKRQKVGRQ